MTSTTTNTAAAPFGPVSNLLNWLGQAMMAIAENNPRLVAARRLHAMSDAELAEIGLTRDRIAEYVFRGAYHT